MASDHMAAQGKTPGHDLQERDVGGASFGGQASSGKSPVPSDSIRTIVRVRDNVNTLVVSLRDMTKATLADDAEIKKLKARVGEMERERDHYAEENNELKARVGELGREQDELKARVGVVERGRDQLAGEHNELKARIGVLELERDQLANEATELKKLKTQQNQGRDKPIEAKDEIKRVTLYAEEVERQNGQLEALCMKLKSKSDKLKEEIRVLQSVQCDCGRQPSESDDDEGQDSEEEDDLSETEDEEASAVSGKKRRCSAGSRGTQEKKKRRGIAFIDSEDRVATLIQEFEDKKPWDAFYYKRPLFPHTFKYDELHPDAQGWVNKLLKYQRDFRHELWENNHRFVLSQDWPSLHREIIRRRNRRSRSRNHWAKVEAEGHKLIAMELLDKDVFKEPFIWAFSEQVVLLPLKYKTLAEVASLDEKEPARCFYVAKIDEHPFYASEAFEKHKEKHPLFHSISPNR